MIIIRYLVPLCLATGMVGCSHNAAQTSTIPVSIKTALPTTERTATASLPPMETTAIPLSQPTVTAVFPSPTITPTSHPPTPVPAPLSRNGPWLLLSKGTYYNGPRGIIDPILTNADGSAWEPLNVPHPPGAGPDEYNWWYAEQVPNKPLLVIRGYFSEYFPDCTNNFFSPTTINPHDDLLSIIRLPENKIIRQFQLIGAEAKAQIRKDDCSLKEGDGIPTVLGVTRLPNLHFWSHDGRNLVFPAAPDGPAADLYLYDFETDTISRLTTRQNNPDILGWSPNGQTIVYQGVAKIDWYHERVIESNGVFAVSTSGIERMLFKPKFVPAGIAWLSQTQFLVSDGYCDIWGTGLCSSDLHLIDLSAGSDKVVYSSSSSVWINYVTDPIHHLLLFVDPPADMPGAKAGKPKLDLEGKETGSVQGIFQYDFQTGVLNPVMLETLPDDIVWNQSYQAFVLNYFGENPPIKSRILMRYTPEQGFYKEELDPPVYSSGSPDGRWIVGQVGNENYIMDNQGHPFQKVMNDWGYWAPDSSSFIQLIEKPDIKETWLLVYSREKDWQNTLTRYLPSGYQWWGMWINPKN